MRTIKLCASPTQQSTTLLAAIRRSAIELERSGRIRRPLPVANATTAPA
jgi:hypothetical protein